MQERRCSLVSEFATQQPNFPLFLFNILWRLWFSSELLLLREKKIIKIKPELETKLPDSQRAAGPLLYSLFNEPPHSGRPLSCVSNKQIFTRILVGIRSSALLLTLCRFDAKLAACTSQLLQLIIPFLIFLKQIQSNAQLSWLYRGGRDWVRLR